jgi:hypothetical protein
MHSEEWGDAKIVQIADGVFLYLKYAEGSLFLGLSTHEPVVGNVLVRMGDRVRIMHSSAALGTAVYIPGDGMWERIQDFVWRCRSRTLSQRATSERESFLQEEGWLASITFMGEHNHLEYQIADLAKIGRLALVLLPTTHPRDLIPWPTDLAQDLFPGAIPLHGTMDPRQWWQLQLDEPEAPPGDEA